MKKVIPILSLALLLSACSFHTGNISTGSHIDCPLMYVATGTASYTRILEIGGSNIDALILEAKRDLYRKFPYTKGIKLSNFSVDYKNTFFLIFHTTKVTVSADVYNCNTSILSDSLENNLPLNINGFNIKDTVMFNDNEDGLVKATILSHNADGTVKISYYSPSLLMITKFSTSYNKIYKLNQDPENINNFGFEIGEKVKVILLNKNKNYKTKAIGVIKAINSENAIVEFKNNNIVSTQIVEKQLLKK
jgi:hypothetical protein